MAKILSFRGKEDSSTGQTFLADDAEKLSFLTGDDGAVSLDEVSTDQLPTPTIFADPSKDWSNQELADLFRVRQLLSGANVPVETLRGVTDEGDPWFLFCHLNGDVFIHMARIDGFYVLDSPNVERPLRGIDFNALIADFSGDALPSYDKTGDGKEDNPHRVIRLERGGKVRLHPSAMLAALIWTLFLASEELVMMAPEEHAEGSDDLLDFSDLIAADAAFAALETDASDEAATAQAVETFKMDHEDTIQTGTAPEGQMRDTMGQQGLAMQQNAYAIGLSTIAIAMGFVSEVVLMDNQRKVLEGLKALGMTTYAEGTTQAPELDQMPGQSSEALLEKLAEFLNMERAETTDVAAASATPDADSLLQQDMLHVNTAAVDLNALPSATTIENLAKKDDADLTEAPSEELSSDTDATLLIAATAQQQDSEDDGNSMTALMNGKLQMEEFELGGTTVMASFDLLEDDDAFSLSDLFLGQRTTDHQSFDERAQSFIDFIHAKETEVGIVTIGNEIIMIDRDAFRYDGAENYSLSWETYDGQVISMIGLRSEFQQFDLIA